MRAWCEAPAIGIRNIGAGSLGFGFPHGRVVAKIVCYDTLVQYAACACPCQPEMVGWRVYHSIPIILAGVALHLFFQVSLYLLIPFCLYGLVLWDWKGLDLPLLICWGLAFGLDRVAVMSRGKGNPADVDTLALCW